MPAVFDKLGVRFLYPDNWVLDESDAVSGNRAVTVYSPGGAFWSISLHPRSTAAADLASAALRALREEYPEAEAEPARETIAGQELQGYDVNFFYLDLTNTAQVRVLDTGRELCAVHTQAEDREFIALEAVFRAMTASLVQSTLAQ
jgi:hypothetical protein